MSIDELFTWEQIKHKVHDASGITESSKWLWCKSNGIFYPFMRIGTNMPHLEKEDLGADEFTVDIIPEDWKDPNQLALDI